MGNLRSTATLNDTIIRRRLGRQINVCVVVPPTHTNLLLKSATWARLIRCSLDKYRRAKLRRRSWAKKVVCGYEYSLLRFLGPTGPTQWGQTICFVTVQWCSSLSTAVINLTINGWRLNRQVLSFGKAFLYETMLNQFQQQDTLESNIANILFLQSESRVHRSGLMYLFVCGLTLS